MSELEGFSTQDVLDLIELIDANGRRLLARDAHDLSLAFREVWHRRLTVDTDLLVRWIGVIRPGCCDQPGLDAIGASLCNDGPEVRQALQAVLLSPPPVKGEPTARILAAQALARLGDTGSADRIVDLLDEMFGKDDVRELARVTVALEMLGAPSIATRLQAMLPQASPKQVYWLKRAIGRLTGHWPAPPDVDWETDPDGYGAADLKNWMQCDLSSPLLPRVRCAPVSSTVAEVVIDDGRSLLALEPDDPDWDDSWPEWTFSWCHDHQRLYETGSGCSTCDVLLNRIGWAPADAVRLAQTVREQMSDVDALDAPLLAVLEPILGALASGRYQARLLDIPLKACTWADTWFADEDMRYMSVEVSHADRVQVIYQLPAAVRPRPFVIAPTQPPETIDPTTVAAYQESIRAGRHPSAIIAAHSAERQAWNAEAPTRSVTGFIIDGHHKVTAYTSLGLPVRTILICDRTPRQPPCTNNPLSIFDELLNGV